MEPRRITACWDQGHKSFALVNFVEEPALKTHPDKIMLEGLLFTRVRAATAMTDYEQTMRTVLLTRMIPFKVQDGKMVCGAQ